MCGRYTLAKPDKIKIKGVSAADIQGAKLRFNVAPEQDVLSVIQSGDVRHALYLHWGLIPHWSKDGKGFINAKAETINEKPSFRESFKRRRCLIVADGFYEWKALQGKTKQPYYFQMQDQSVFAFAGVWDTWNQGDGINKTTSCVIITTEPNELVASVHDRMPVILHPSSYDAWLDNETSVDQLKEWLLPYPAEYMQAIPVSKNVNSP